MLGVLQARKGVRLQGNVVTMNLAGIGNAFTIFQLSNFANMIGTATFRLKRVKGLNAVAPGADTVVHIGRGTGAGFVDMIPPLLTIDGMNFDFVEFDLPEVEWSTDMTAWPVAATVTIQVEIEELK